MVEKQVMIQFRYGVDYTLQLFKYLCRESPATWIFHSFK